MEVLFNHAAMVWLPSNANIGKDLTAEGFMSKERNGDI